MTKLVIAILAVFLFVPVQGLMEQREQQDKECAQMVDRRSMTPEQLGAARWKCGTPPGTLLPAGMGRR